MNSYIYIRNFESFLLSFDFWCALPQLQQQTIKTERLCKASKRGENNDACVCDLAKCQLVIKTTTTTARGTKSKKEFMQILVEKLRALWIWFTFSTPLSCHYLCLSRLYCVIVKKNFLCKDSSSNHVTFQGGVAASANWLQPDWSWRWFLPRAYFYFLRMFSGGGRGVLYGFINVGINIGQTRNHVFVIAVLLILRRHYS